MKLKSEENTVNEITPLPLAPKGFTQRVLDLGSALRQRRLLSWSALSSFALLGLLSGRPADASIISTTGPVLIIAPPASVVPGATVNKKDAQVFDERQNLALSSALGVNATGPGTYSNGSGPGGSIPAGADVSTYFILFDSGGASDNYPTVTLTFSTRILGVIFDDSTLNSSDAILGDPGTKYPTGVTARGQDSGDSTAISANGFTITLSDITGYPGDDIRVVTGGVNVSTPEPGTWGFLSFGIVFITLCLAGRKRRAPRQ